MHIKSAYELIIDQAGRGYVYVIVYVSLLLCQLISKHIKNQ